MVKQMKGRTTCPKCKKEFVLDLPEDNKNHEVTCPKCNNKFLIKTKCDEKKSKKECSWEEYGEPRKTILSSIKPKTNKPLICGIILLCVFGLGISTTVFSETFVETSLDTAKAVGLTGTVKITITDQFNNSLDNITVVLNEETIEPNGNGTYYKQGVELGIHALLLSNAEAYKTKKVELLIAPFIVTESTVEMEEGIGEAETVYFDFVGCSIILGIFSVFALLGMIACFKRQHFDLALAGSFLAIFSFGFFFIGSILSIISFVVVMRSREEFEDGKKGKIF